MNHILKEWNGHRGEPVGVYVTKNQVCYWQRHRENVFARIELSNWLAGDWASKVFLYLDAGGPGNQGVCAGIGGGGGDVGQLRHECAIPEE